MMERTEYAYQYRAPGKTWTRPLACKDLGEAEQLVDLFEGDYSDIPDAKSRVLVRKVITLPWQPLKEDLD
jgi:hypothetical protein